jgi:hypothetical protein
MSEDSADDPVRALRAELIAAIMTAHAARRGDPRPIEPLIRTYAKSQREAGVSVALVLIEVKALLRDHAGRDSAAFTPKLVGWTVAGYYAGT